MLTEALGYPVRGEGAKRFLILTAVYLGGIIAMTIVMFVTVFGAAMGSAVMSGPTGPGAIDPGGASALMSGVGLVVALLITVVSLGLGAFVLGYNVRVLRTTTDGADELPAFGDLKGLFVDGFAAIGIYVAYFLPMLLVIVLGAFAEMTALVWVSLLLVLPIGYLFPVGLSAYASGGFTAAFAIGRIGSLATTADYAVAWVLALVVLFLSGILNFVLSLIPLVGSFVGAALGIYVGLVAFRLFGEGVRKAATGL